MKNSEILKRCKKIKLVISDVDGVLTDGSMYYSEKGEQLKQFHTRDGMGVTLLRKIKIPTIIITKEKTKMVRMWAKKMNVAYLYDGVSNKAEILDKFDHKNLNLDVEDFKDLNPTAENIIKVIYNKLRKKMEDKFELKIKLYETERNIVVYPA